MPRTLRSKQRKGPVRPASRRRAPTQTMASITRRFGALRDETSLLDADVSVNHRSAQLRTLELLTRDRPREDVVSLLEELSTGRGLGWSDIARLVGVTVQAVNKWRRREPATGQNRLAVLAWPPCWNCSRTFQ